MGPIETLVVTLVGAGVGAYFGSYLRQKGKNLATREDIDKIARETEAIKAQISGELWVQQKRWDFKHQVYVRLLESLAEVDQAVTIVANVEQRKAGSSLTDRERELIDEQFQRIKKGVLDVAKAQWVGATVVPREVLETVNKLQVEWRPDPAQIDSPEFFRPMREAVQRAMTAVALAARKDLLGFTEDTGVIGGVQKRP